MSPERLHSRRAVEDLEILMAMPSLANVADYDPILDINEAAEYTKRHPQTLRKAVRLKECGCLRTVPNGRLLFRLSQLNAWLKRQEVRPSRVREA